MFISWLLKTPTTKRCIGVVVRLRSAACFVLPWPEKFGGNFEVVDS